MKYYIEYEDPIDGYFELDRLQQIIVSADSEEEARRKVILEICGPGGKIVSSKLLENSNGI